MDVFLKYLIVFAVGGILCAIAQIIIDKTKLSPARILVIYVCTGVLLSGLGIYTYIVNFANAGACSIKIPALISFLFPAASSSHIACITWNSESGNLT